MEKSKSKKLFLMSGIPGSGKSTWAENHLSAFGNDANIVSRDKIRFSLLEEKDTYFGKEKEVWNAFVQQCMDSITNHEVTIIDATHISEASRNRILRILTPVLKDVEINIIVINPGVDTAIQQNNNRTGRAFVPASVIRRMAEQFTMPKLEEGFDNIYIKTGGTWRIVN